MALLLVGLGIGCGGQAPTSDTSTPQPYDSIFDLAEGVYFAGDYDSAQVLLDRVIDVARRELMPAEEARALTWVSLVAYRRGDFEHATAVGHEALSIKLERGLRDQLARSYNALGLIAYQQNRLSESLHWYALASDAAQEHGDERMAVSVAANVALSLIELGGFAEARERLLSAREYMAAVDDARLEGNALLNLGMLEIRLGNPGAGLASLDEAIGRYREVGYLTGVTLALGHVATGLVVLGQPGAALATLDSAMTLAMEQGLRAEEASLHELMADVYRNAGDFPRALELYARARSLNQEIGGLEWETGIDLRGEADIQVRLGALGPARERALEALELHKVVGAPMEEMRDLLVVAEVSDRLEDDDHTRSYLRQADSLASALGAPISRVELALSAARIHDRHRRADSVLTHLERVGDDLSRGGYRGEWEAAFLRSRALLRLGDLEGAATAGRQALDMVERVRGDFGSGALRTSFTADKREVYAQLVSVLLRAGRRDEAFQVADAARGRALLEGSSPMTPRTTSAGSTSDSAEIALREVVALEQRIAFFEDFRPSDRSAVERRELDGLYRSLAATRSRFERLAGSQALEDPRGAALLGNRRIDTDLVRGSLRSDQLLLEYFVPDEGPVMVFALSATEMQVFETGVDREGLVSRVRLVRALIGERTIDATLRTVLAGLFDLLIRPAIVAGLASGAQDLVVVPHDVLSYLPFAALVDSTTGRYLIEDHLVRVLPSAAVLPLARSRAPPAELSSAAAAVLAPFPRDLPASMDEAETIARHTRARRLVGRSATERALRDALGTDALVHVATHGLLNAGNPAYSALALAPGADNDGRDDGRLEAHELLALTVRADLVFLSGCETGLGVAGSSVYAPGEDFTTLSQAFLVAGARNVVGTLWPVEDRASSVLVEHFYEGLARGDAGRALASAQRAMIGDPRYAAPYFWAPYQVAGSPGASGPIAAAPEHAHQIEPDAV